MSTPLVSIIVPTFNDSKRLELCLNSLENQSYPKQFYEVIVIDNNSEEDIKGTVDQFNQTQITYESCRGSYAARNKGISVAKGTIFGFTDSDCIPAASWIEKGVENLLKTPNCGLVAGEVQLFFRDPKKPTVFEVYDKMNFLRQKHYIESYKFGATANLFTSKEIFEAVGLFDPDLKSGGDSDWGKRVFAAGYTQTYADDVLVAHPARHQWQEIRKKVVRITEGLYHQEKERQSLVTFLIEILRDLKSPFKELNRVLNNKDSTGFIQKTQLMALVISLRHLKVRNKVKLYLKH